MEELKQSVKKLVSEELARANTKYPLFHSAHEGYAIIKEEIEEAEIELNRIKQMFAWAWETIKINETPNDRMDSIKRRAIYLASEAIQVAAMAQKFIDSFKVE